MAEAEADRPVHRFVLSGQLSMQGMDPEIAFLPDANKLFKGDAHLLSSFLKPTRYFKPSKVHDSWLLRRQFSRINCTSTPSKM